MCDIGKGVTRMLTPSERQIQFVSAAAPIVSSVTGMEAAKAAAAAGRPYTPMPSTQTSGYENMSLAQQEAMRAMQQSSAGGKWSTETKLSLGIGAAVAVAGLAILFWPK